MKFTTLTTFSLLSLASASNFFQQASSNANELSGNTNKRVPGESPLEFCSDPASDLVTIESVNLIPNPPQIGATLKIEASGIVNKEIGKGSYVQVWVKYGLIKLISETLDLCEHVKEVDLECPIKEGRLILQKSVDIPSQVPPGKYTVEARAFTADDEPITCITGQVVFPAY